MLLDIDTYAFNAVLNTLPEILEIIYSELGKTARFSKVPCLPGFKYTCIEEVYGLAAISVYKIWNVSKWCMKIKTVLVGQVRIFSWTQL